MAFLDESEIEDWFAEEKTKLDDLLYKESYARKNIPVAKKKYDAKLAKLLHRYEQEYQNLEKRITRKKKMRAPYLKLKIWWKELKQDLKRRHKRSQKTRKQRKFEKEYKKLMKK